MPRSVEKVLLSTVAPTGSISRGPEVRSEAVTGNLLLQFNILIINPSRNSLLLPCLGDSLQTHPGPGLKCQRIDNFTHLGLGSAP